MKVVVAVIKPFRLNAVHDALHTLGVAGFTVYEAKGHGRQKGHSDIYRSVEYVANFLPKLRVEVIVATGLVDRVVEAIATAARTGESGDGKIYVHSVDQVMRIRNGATDENAV